MKSNPIRKNTCFRHPLILSMSSFMRMRIGTEFQSFGPQKAKAPEPNFGAYPWNIK